MSIKSSIVASAIIGIIYENSHILAFYCRTCIRRVRRDQSAS